MLHGDRIVSLRLGARIWNGSGSHYGYITHDWMRCIHLGLGREFNRRFRCPFYFSENYISGENTLGVRHV